MGKRILLITPKFYGIENKIKSSLEESGYSVVWIENKTLTLDYHGTYSKCKFLRSIYFFLFSPQIRYVKKQFKTIDNHHFDLLFSINAHIISSWLLRYLKARNPKLYSVLFLWDSFSMYNWTNELKYFNRVLTFDPEDSRKFNLEYKPIFFIKRNQQKSDVEEFDMFFVGKFAPYRLSFIDKILGSFKNSDIKYYIKLWPAYKIFFHNRIFYSLFKIINPNNSWTQEYILNYEAIEGILKREYIMTSSMKFEEIQQYFFSSNVILDIPFQGQVGYSHRLIEALANGKKIITTNVNLLKESFFNSAQIQILDNRDMKIDCIWLKEKVIFPVNNILLNLELSVWLKTIINVATT